MNTILRHDLSRWCRGALVPDMTGGRQLGTDACSEIPYAGCAMTHISYRIGIDLRLLRFLSRRRAVQSGIFASFLLLVSVSHGDVSLSVPSCIGACTAPSLEAREFRCRVQNVGPYQATTPQYHSRLGTGIPCTRRRSNSGSVCETFRVVVFTKSSTVRACEFH